MTTTDKQDGLQHVHEAQNPLTPCERQVELATHPNMVVRRALAKNPVLCEAAKEVLGDELDKLRQAAADDVRDTLE